ncbi:exodeoxyribonuclease V subunit beta [Vibrio sp. F74]|uniref:exodeoxyribonuclease V subunit beta n=1 Tax=Vibrio sp. F74 TaxID=700020 RepID=UPI0035F5317E
MPQTLNTMSFPLHGARLIEASAGTGKTFTISGLYLRLLLGHGDQESRHTSPLTVDQILVVTFTEAATAELRERIRSKIHDARIAFLRGESNDPVIKLLLEQLPDTKQVISVLLNAERQMDEAAIFTIHGFCQRMLTQNAFESGSRFNNEFITDESKLKAQVVADYWRRNFYSLSLNLANEVRTIWREPELLLKDISTQLTGVPVTLTVEAMEDTLEALHLKNLALIESLKAFWKESVEDIPQIINDSDVSKRSFTKKNLPAWINEISQWAENPTEGYQCPDKLEKFTQEFLIEKTPENKVIPDHPLFAYVSRFIANKPSIKEPLLAHAIQVCRDNLQQIKQERHWLSFDDLLTNLSAAIDTDEQGNLTARIRHLFPVAMIDEFQDTDPLQYSIFSRIYLSNPESGLLMIGDPKQAIYGFRGADIFTYIRARNEVADHYTLDINWRSSADMVNATNGIFTQANSPFVYDNDIPFYPVNPSPDAENRSWWLDGVKQKALTYWLQETDEPVAKTDYTNSMAVGTAEKISQILQSSDEAYFLDSKGQRKSIQAGNIAVLVRTGSEGQLVRQELAKKGVASVYLSNRDSVFKSAMASAILRLLQAVLYPEDERILRAALASDVLMKSSRALDNLNENEIELEAKINAFKAFRVVWQQRGVMPMLRAIMSAEGIGENLLAQEFGERLITDFLHLAELLQQASLTLDSDHALVRWFTESIQDIQQGGSAGDEQIQRLESERNLVQIVTIHKSKGLEYDLVFLPFASAYRESKNGQYYDQQLETTFLDITLQPTSVALSDKERLAEDLRLLYVAITRAVYGCFVGIAPLRKGRSRKDPTGAHLSAVGYLLQNGEESSTAEFESTAYSQVAKHQELMVISHIPEMIDNRTQADVVEQIELFDHSDLKEHSDLNARIMHRDIDKSWRVTSYSGLVKQGHSKIDTSAQFEIETQSTGLDIDSAEDKDELPIDEPEATIFNFPRGARPGTFLHTIFEEIDFTLPATSDETSKIVSELLQVEQYEEKWLPILQGMIDTVLSARLDGMALQLCDKDSSRKLVEMEFLLPIKHLSSVLFNDLSKQYDQLSQKTDELGFSDVQGMLKGFIDLVFVHEGKYYILDWKSNHLGDENAAYQEGALQQAMIDHRYDFQYQIYALALHRFLRNRIADYQYDKHFGGVYYLFLRGIDDSGNGIFFSKPDAEFLDRFDSLIDGKRVEVENAK